MRRHGIPWIAAALAAAALLLRPSAARAGNDDAVLLGNAAILSGGALTASVSDGSATWYNFAGLGSVARDSVDVSASAYQLAFGNTPALLSTASGLAAPGDYVDFVVVPSTMTMVRRLEPGVVLGIGIFVPTMRSHDETLDLVEPLGERRADWNLVLRDQRQVYGVRVGVGFALAPNLRVGVGLLGTYDQDITSIHLFGTVREPDGTASVGIGASGYQWRRSVTLGLGAGLQWSPVPGLTLGLSVESPRFAIGSLGTERSVILIADGRGVTSVPGVADGLEPSFEIASPTRVRLGVSWELGPVRLALDADVQHELVNPAVGVDRRTVGGARLGVRVRIDESITVGGGFFSDFSSGRGAFEYSITRAHFLGGSLGIEIRSRHLLGAGDSAPDLEFVQAFGVRYAYGEGHIGGLRFDLAGAGLEIVGTRTTVHETALHVGSGLYF